MLKKTLNPKPEQETLGSSPSFNLPALPEDEIHALKTSKQKMEKSLEVGAFLLRVGQGLSPGHLFFSGLRGCWVYTYGL